VDAVASWEPFGSLVQARVPDAVLVARGGGNIGYYINMAVRNEIIDQKPDLVERYVIAMAEATQYTRQHLDEAAEIATRWVPGLAAAVGKQAIRHMVFDSRITPHTVAAWEENVRILIEQKKLKTALPWQQGVEIRFIEKVMKEHPKLFSDLKPVP
jgi:ABC-type nitrate/sulfonate/bicarbonate transport system substrate-binding protein